MLSVHEQGDVGANTVAPVQYHDEVGAKPVCLGRQEDDDARSLCLRRKSAMMNRSRGVVQYQDDDVAKPVCA